MTKELLEISIIIPVYNVEKYLRRCLDSVIAQTYPNFEVILVNDGSTDNSGVICDEYLQKDKRICVIHAKNSGPSCARNIGLDVVKTPWVTFIDADDYVTPKYLENFFKYNRADVDTQVVQGYYTIGSKGVDDDTLYPSTLYESHIVEVGRRSAYIEDRNLLYNWAVWSKVFSVEIIRKNNIRFEEDIWSGEDGLFWHNYLCYVNKIIFIQEQGYYYYCPRIYNSVSRNGGRKLTTENLITFASNYKRISNILSERFCMSSKYASFLKMYYLNNYYKAVLLSDNLTTEQCEKLTRIRPPKNYIVFTIKGFTFWVINLFPVKFIRSLFRIISR